MVYIYGMKTTVEIPDPLFSDLKQLAAQEQRSVRSLIEDSIRLLFRQQKEQAQKNFKLPDISFGAEEDWLIDPADWETIKREFRSSRPL